MARVLVVSIGPVPTPENQRVEGGGLRCWGLAQGLLANGHRVAVAIDAAYPQPRSEYQGVELRHYSGAASVRELVSQADVVVVSYSAGALAELVVDSIGERTLLVLDCYVPIFTEFAARQSDDLPAEYGAYHNELPVWRRVLQRGDLFLCANQPQRHYYTGILSSLGVLNPLSFQQDRIVMVPSGLHQSEVEVARQSANPYPALGITSKEFVLLWFGGLYPWFDVNPVVEAVLVLAKRHPRFRFVMVGARNPYVAHPDFASRYPDVRERLARLLGGQAHFIDWVDYEERYGWLTHADLVVSLNVASPETTYSWRTRLMDHVVAGLPLMTNGGDPLSDEVIAVGGGLLTAPVPAELVEQVEACLRTPAILQVCREALDRLRPAWFWEAVTEHLAELCDNPSRPWADEMAFARAHRLPLRRGGESRLLRRVEHASRLSQRAREEGLRAALREPAQMCCDWVGPRLHRSRCWQELRRAESIVRRWIRTSR